MSSTDSVTPNERDAAMKNADFNAAYESNAASRAGVDAIVDEFANDRAKYEADVKQLTLPSPPPVKG